MRLHIRSMWVIFCVLFGLSSNAREDKRFQEDQPPTQFFEWMVGSWNAESSYFVEFKNSEIQKKAFAIIDALTAKKSSSDQDQLLQLKHFFAHVHPDNFKDQIAFAELLVTVSRSQPAKFKLKKEGKILQAGRGERKQVLSTHMRIESKDASWRVYVKSESDLKESVYFYRHRSKDVHWIWSEVDHEFILYVKKDHDTFFRVYINSKNPEAPLCIFGEYSRSS